MEGGGGGGGYSGGSNGNDVHISCREGEDLTTSTKIRKIKVTTKQPVMARSLLHYCREIKFLAMV